MVEYGAEVTGAAADVEDVGAWCEEGEEVFCCVAVLQIVIELNLVACN